MRGSDEFCRNFVSISWLPQTASFHLPSDKSAIHLQNQFYKSAKRRVYFSNHLLLSPIRCQNKWWLTPFRCFSLRFENRLKLYSYHQFPGKISESSIIRYPNGFFGNIIQQQILAQEIWFMLPFNWLMMMFVLEKLEKILF